MCGVSSTPSYESEHMTQAGQSEYSILWPKKWASTQAWLIRAFSMTVVQMLGKRSPISIEIAKLEGCGLPATWTKPVWEWHQAETSWGRRGTLHIVHMCAAGQWQRLDHIRWVLAQVHRETPGFLIIWANEFPFYLSQFGFNICSLSISLSVPIK